MKSFTGAVLFIAFAVGFALGQSGRRTDTVPAPRATPNAVAQPTVEVLSYSETQPVEKRPIQRPPPKLDNKAKKESVKVNAAGAGQASTLNRDEGDVLSIETNLVSVPVSVFDRGGLYIPNLKQTDFKVFENGEEQAITYFGGSEKPFTVVLLLDTSPSTQYKIEEIQRAAMAFVDQLKPQDRVLVVNFDRKIHVQTEPTSDRRVIFQGIREAKFGTGTAIYDAVEFSLAKRLKAIGGRKAVVIFTDGVDTQSDKADYDSSIGLAEESDALIFPIYYNTYSDNRIDPAMIDPNAPPIRMQGLGLTADEYALGKRYLEDLAAYTGGRIFRPEATPGGLTAAFEGIAEELRRQYVIGYVPDKDAKPGERRRIKVRVNRPNLVIRSRDGYVVGERPVASEGPVN